MVYKTLPTDEQREGGEGGAGGGGGFMNTFNPEYGREQA